MLEKLNKESFAEHINTKFRLIHEDSPALDLELIEVSGPGVEGRQERFYLLFRGPLEIPFGQGLRHLEHEPLGTLELFLVPVAREADGIHYEAVFNRLVG